MDNMTNAVNEFDALLKGTSREGMYSLVDWLHTTDFYTAPASTKYHGACERGLLYHSLVVHDCAVTMYNKLYSTEGWGSIASVIIASLLHDICKANCYSVYQKNVKKDGIWVQEDAYKFDEQFCFGGHGSKSVYLAQQFIELTPEEATAINCHMGFTNADNINAISNAYQNCPLAWLIHVADEMATFIYKT